MFTWLNASVLADANVSEMACQNAQKAAIWVYSCTQLEAWAHVVVLALSQVKFNKVSQNSHGLIRTLMVHPEIKPFFRLRQALFIVYQNNLQLDCYYMSAVCVFIIFGYSVNLFSNEEFQLRRTSFFQHLWQLDFGEFNCKQKLLNAFGCERSFWTCHVSYNLVITMSTEGVKVLNAFDMGNWIVHKTQMTTKEIKTAPGIYMELLRTYIAILEEDRALRVVYYDQRGAKSLEICVN